MKRTPLSHGSVITSPSANYTIDSVIGQGANCVVYKAHYSDNNGYNKDIILKECYPHYRVICLLRFD